MRMAEVIKSIECAECICDELKAIEREIVL